MMAPEAYEAAAPAPALERTAPPAASDSGAAETEGRAPLRWPFARASKVARVSRSHMLASCGHVASHVTEYMRPRGKPRGRGTRGQPRGRDTWTCHVHREHDSPSWPEHRWSGHDDLSRCRIAVEEAEKLEKEKKLLEAVTHYDAMIQDFPFPEKVKELRRKITELWRFIQIGG